MTTTATAEVCNTAKRSSQEDMSYGNNNSIPDFPTTGGQLPSRISSYMRASASSGRDRTTFSTYSLGKDNCHQNSMDWLEKYRVYQCGKHITEQKYSHHPA